MAVPYTISQVNDATNLAIQRLWPKMTDLEVENYRLIYNAESTEDYIDRDSSVSGFSQAARLTDGAIITAESPVQNFDQTYTQVAHANMAVFTFYNWKYGIQRRDLEGVVKDLKGSVLRKREYLTTGYLENSIGSATSMTVTDRSGDYSKSVTGGDALALINSAHTREDGGATWSNVISDGVTSNMDFAPDALRAAFRTSSQIRDPKGNLMSINPNKVVCRRGSKAFFDAMEYNGALKKDYKPNSADRDGAPFGAYDIIALPYQTVTNEAYWWIFDESMRNQKFGLQYRGSMEPTFDGTEIEFKTKSIYASAMTAFDYGHNDGRGWDGSTGANA